MATLWDQLNDLFPKVLSSEASAAINGTSLLERVRPRLVGKYEESSIRQHFSEMSKDPTSSIAKVSGGHGYYLRNAESRVIVQPAAPSGSSVEATVSLGREAQLEEKFRSIFMRYMEQSGQQFPMHVEHTRATKKEAGVNQWKFPDVVLLSWGVGKVTDQGYKLDQDLLAVKTSLGEPPFTLQSIELKVSLTLSTFRENFFQCVSNSKWAHRSILAVANGIDDKTLRDELQRLGASYDVSIISYNLSSAMLEGLPSASEILKMPISEFEQLISGTINETQISNGKERAALDWEHVNDLRSISSDFVDLFEWIAYCLLQKGAYRFEDFSHIRKIKKRI
jgi:hypothetical protein